MPPALLKATKLTPVCPVSACVCPINSPNAIVWVADPPLTPTILLPVKSVPFAPALVFPTKFGTLNVVLPSPDPHATPITAKRSAYVVLDTAVPSHTKNPDGAAVPPKSIIEPVGNGATTAFGVISSVCCIGGIPKMIADGPWGTISYANNTTTNYSLPPTNFGLYRIYIEVADINLKRFSKAMKIRNELSFRPWYATPPGTPPGTVPPGSNLYDDDMIINITSFPDIGWGDAVIWPWLIQSINLIQGSIPPSQNQTKYNATKQSYMSCLENQTKTINFAITPNLVNNN